jgi:hypothetical protein
VAEAHHSFDDEVRRLAHLDEIGSIKVHTVRERMAVFTTRCGWRATSSGSGPTRS